MPSFADQVGRTITLNRLPRRIVSLVPSQTELLFDLELDEQVTGITKFCVHPPGWLRTKVKVGGTKTLKTDLIKTLEPDLILANKEENVKEQVDELAGHFPVWISDVNNLTTAREMIASIGIMTGKEKIAASINDQIQQHFSQLHFNDVPFNTVYLIWRNPYMTVGGDTFISDMLMRCGFKNIFAGQQRYPSITVEALKEKDCRLLLLPSEPFPFKEKHLIELQQQLPLTIIRLVDGEMFSWYGSRLLKAAVYFELLAKQLRAIN